MLLLSVVSAIKKIVYLHHRSLQGMFNGLRIHGENGMKRKYFIHLNKFQKNMKKLFFNFSIRMCRHAVLFL